MAIDSDDFDFSSGDEAALLAAAELQESLTSTKQFDHSPSGHCLKQAASAYPETSPLALEILQRHFGLTAFRLEQEPVIARLLAGGSAVVVFPTGGGKSLCYQLPALCFPEVDRQNGAQKPEDSGITIVVSPLIALMKDQVDALQKRRIPAACLDSTKGWAEVMATYDQMRAGTLRLLYCAPERLNNEGFVESIKHVRGGVKMVAIDEAHCISEWGHAFRPDYLKVARFVSEINAERVVCLTATATPLVAKDICKAFKIDDTGLFRTSMYRPNLRLLAEAVPTRQEAYGRLFSFLRENPGPSIVYVTLQKQSEDLANALQKQGFQARAFHAGIDKTVKTLVQDEFMTNQNLIICATIAFGMGIDKPNIRSIVHFDIPSSVEGYCQQIGRAGRDGLPSTCMLYLCHEAIWLQENLTYGDLPSESSLKRLVDEVCLPENVNLQLGGEIRVNQYDQSSRLDIKANLVNIIYAQLELQFGLIRATTPQYTSYSYEILNENALQEDTSRAANEIRSRTKGGRKWQQLDLDLAGQNGTTRSEIVNKLNDWSHDRCINLKTSGTQHVYRVCRKLPTDEQEKNGIVHQIHSQMEAREQQSLGRIHRLITIFTGDECFSRRLADFFQPGSTDVPRVCGHCTWCETHARVNLHPKPVIPTDHCRIGKLLEAVEARDDPRFLARIAFGITSPRATKLKLRSNPVWESLADHNFLELIRIFTAVCKNAPGEYPGKLAPSPSSRVNAGTFVKRKRTEGDSKENVKGRRGNYSDKPEEKHAVSRNTGGPLRRTRRS